MRAGGIVTTLAGFLISRAFDAAEVSTVVALTAPEQNAPTRIFEKHAFVRDVIAMDADIGEAWRWKKPRTL